MTTPIKDPKKPHLAVGRRIHELPENIAKRREAQLRARHQQEREQAEQKHAADRAENARLADELHRTEVAHTCDMRPCVRDNDSAAKKLRTAVEKARQAWAVAGRKGQFDAFGAVARAEYELGLVAVAPAPKTSDVLGMALPPPRQEARAPLGDGSDAEHRAQMTAASDRGRLAAEQKRMSDDAYRARLRAMGLEVPGQGSAGAFTRPF